MVAVTAMTLVLIVACALMGWWQVGRVYRPVDGYAAEPTAVALDALAPVGNSIPAAALSREVLVTGNYAQSQVFATGHQLAGAPITWVVSTLVLPDHTGILVVRGWLQGPDQALAQIPTTSVAVTGRLESGSPGAGSSPAVSGLVMRAGYLVRTAQSPPDPLSLQPVPALAPTNQAPNEFHLQNAIYVIQWFLLIGVVGFGWFRLRRAAGEALVTASAAPLKRQEVDS